MMGVSRVWVPVCLLLAAVALWPLERLFPAHRDQPLWRADTRLDILYWLSLTGLRTGLMALAALPALALGLYDVGWLKDGFDPLARQPVWLQVVVFVVAFDLTSYWVHRWFHSARLWKFHAIHHSSPQLDWLSSQRHHPVNDLALRVGQALPVLLLGLPLEVLAWCLLLLTLHSLFIHANLKWGFGPLGWVVVSPAYHHWHHTSQAEGLDRNFAEVCPVWDLLFGTWYMPAGRRAERYGIHDRAFPGHFVGQLLYPFRRARGPG